MDVKFDPHANTGRYPLDSEPLPVKPLPDFEFMRASGECLCRDCGKLYYSHPYNLDIVTNDGFPFLHVLCDGTLVKL